MEIGFTNVWVHSERLHHHVTHEPDNGIDHNEGVCKC